MYAGISAAYLPALRGPHQAYGFVEAWRSGMNVPFDGERRLPLVDGTVTVDGSTPGVRRTLSASFAPTPGLWDALAPTGTELWAFTAIRYPSGVEEVVPQGVFDIDVQSMGYASSGDIKVTAPDRWVRVQRARFLTPRKFGGGTTRSVIASLLNQAMPGGITTTDLATSSATVPRQTIDRDRAGFIQDLAKAASLDVFMDRNGGPVIRDAPTINQSNSVWTVDASQAGVLIDATRERSRQRTYNLVVVNSSRNDGVAPFATVYVWDADPNSPTYAGPDPVNQPELAAAFGVRSTFYTSPLLTTTSQAQAAGGTILAKVTGLAAQLSLTSIANPALDDGDTVTVQLPRERADMPRPVEQHIVDRLTVPLVPSRSPMTIDTRSTLADYSEGDN